jgi:ribosomal protein S18 acetylase RimI-like enzyme
VDHSRLSGVLPDHEVRAATFDDVPAITAHIGRVTTALLGYPDASEAEVRDDLTGLRFDIARDTVVAVRADGDVVVYAQGFDENDDSAWMDVYVDPRLEPADFDAVADATVATCLEQIRSSVVARGGSGTQVKAGIYQQESQMRAAYERAGLSVDALYWRMAVELTPDADYTFSLPAGVQIRRVDPDDDGVLRVALDLQNQAFSEHHGSSQMSFDDFRAYWRGTEKYDPEAWWFAVRDGEPVGMLLGDNSRGDATLGYVRSLGVLKPARGQGIAKALLLNAFDDYRRRGRTAMQLGVDSNNATGATRLYEGLGMKAVVSTLSLTRELTV